MNLPGWRGLDLYGASGLGFAATKVVARGTTDLYRSTNQTLEIGGIQGTSTAISVMELMPPRYDGLISRLSEQKARTAD
ncbi:hypothetical protein J2X12_001938 [Pseudarthrobacter oxydans]|uniref:Uncharacterized protein n=1 Tax=Pseudarthrobacter oxydans TaxID=1671 RepID=A0AAW8NDB3_PSEOX|nr:hypothetical protein [Pseudarthrobacter oxydans]MDR6793037.1 hypothetical protein [Pseudarthrobacter oxydans]MDR7163923.1 hypothetical protein [Pseudarthrobacter oxydans]